jgi:hypothetical protein
MARKLVWIENQRFQGLGYSQCDWVFQPSGPPVGESLAKMMKVKISVKQSLLPTFVWGNQRRQNKKLSRSHDQRRNRKKGARDIVNGQVKDDAGPVL